MLAVGQPLSNDLLVFVATYFRVVFSKVDIFALQRDNGLARGLVVTVRRESFGGSSHARLQDLELKTVVYRFSSSFLASLPDVGRYAKSR